MAGAQLPVRACIHAATMVTEAFYFMRRSLLGILHAMRQARMFTVRRFNSELPLLSVAATIGTGAEPIFKKFLLLDDLGNRLHVYGLASSRLLAAIFHVINACGFSKRSSSSVPDQFDSWNSSRAGHAAGMGGFCASTCPSHGLTIVRGLAGDLRIPDMGGFFSKR